MINKQNPIFLYEFIIVPDHGILLNEVSFLNGKSLALKNIESFVKNIFGPFESQQDAFHSLGNHYRFSLKKNYECSLERSFIVRKERSFYFSDSRPRKIEYFLYFSEIEKFKPIRNLKKVMDKYYPYGPDL